MGRFVTRVAAEWDLDAPGQSWRSIDASLVFVDISGFTNLSERLARRGRIGAEELTEVLNRVFGTMLGLAYQRGGLLLKFGGDALLLLFREEGHAAQAVSAAVEMRAALQEAAAIPTSVGRVPLRMSVGVHSGEVQLFRVGHSHDELVITGPAATQATAMEHAAGPGEIVVSSATRQLLPPGAADVRQGPGWRLRWRRPKVPAVQPIALRPVGPEAVERCIPLALRTHLSESSLEPEHRAATVGFVRFQGVEQLMVTGGTDAAAVALDELIRTVQDAVDAEGVTFLATDIDEDGGKVILAAGVPATQEDDEGRMLRSLRRIADAKTRLELQIGVNRGHVFSGEVGMAFRSTFTVMGDTVNVAARLMAAAPPGEIYVTAPVLDRSRTSFVADPLPPLLVKGKTAPLQAFAAGPEIGRRDDTDQDTLPFTGRTSELETIDHQLQAVIRGRGGALVVEGETGVGKSRLTAEALARHPGLVISTVRGEPYGTTFPYRALRDAVRQLVGVERAEPEVMSRQLVRRLRALDRALVPVAPLIGEVADITVPSTAEVDEIEPRFRRDRMAEAIIRLIEDRVSGPLVVVVEDAHWVDEASAHLLASLVAAAEAPEAPRPWLVIAIRRRSESGFLPPAAPGLVLEPLTPAEAEELVCAATEATPLRPHDLTAIVSRAAGNPLFLQEILRLVAQTGGTAALPESLDSVVGAEIDALPPRLRRLLRCASVLGRSFRLETFQLLMAGEGTEIDGALDDELSRFLEADGDRWHFRHALVRDVAYEGLSYRRRRELHRRAGAATERLAGGNVEQVAEMLARHYTAAQDHDMAWRYARIAAERARASYANVEAATHYEDALDAVRRLPEVGDRERAAMLSGLGDVREQLGMYDAALDAYRRATRLLRDDPLASARLALRRGRAREQTGAYLAALREVRAAAGRLAAVDSDEAGRWAARLTAFEAVVRQGQQRPNDALAVARRAVEAAKQSGERFALAQAYGVMDWALIVLGRPEEAVHASLALAIYEELGDLSRQAAALNNLGAAAYFEGRWDVAVTFYERSKDASLRSGNAVQAALGSMNIGEILVNQGRLDEAEPLLREARRVLRASGSEAAEFAELQLGRIHMDRGQLDQAERLLTHAHQDARTLGQHESALELAIHLSRCHLLRGDAGLALETLRTAQRASRAVTALYGVQVAEVESLILTRLDLLDDALAVCDLGIADARRQGLVYELALLVLTRADIESRAGREVDDAAVDEANSLLRGLGCDARMAPQPALSS